MPRRRKLDPILVVEACYSGAPDDREWLDRILESLEPAAHGQGLCGWVFRRRGGGNSVRTFVSRGGVHARWTSVGASNKPPELLRVMYAPAPPVGLASRRLRGVPEPGLGRARSFLRDVGAEDALWIVAADLAGEGVALAVPLAGGRAPHPRTLNQMAQVTAHLAAARRLRAMAGVDDASRADAVLDPSGRVLQARGDAAQGEARRSLAEAVRRIERARGPLRRRAPEEAVSLWQGLVEGRWSLVEHREADGRRLILARRNEPRVRDPRALVREEREVLAYAAMGHSNKYIGYALGVAPTTVAARLRAALAKLGVRSRLELIQVLGPGAGQPNSRRGPG